MLAISRALRVAGLVLACIVLLPFGAEAQQAGKAYRVGFLTGGSERGAQTRLEAFKKGLREGVSSILPRGIACRRCTALGLSQTLEG